MKASNNLIKLVSAVEIFGICLMVSAAFFFQFIMHELPCPLCLLQRLGLLGIAFGFLLNAHYHVRPSHYSLSLLAAVLTAFISLRQIALHITDPIGYGSTLFGFHMYTWVFILSLSAIIYIALIISFEHQYELHKNKQEISEGHNGKVRVFTHIIFALFITLITTNLLSTYFECGLSQCTDNPTHYLAL